MQNILYSVRFDIGTPHDVQEDFSLPDYMPEVRQIVNCRGTVLPENIFIDQSELVLSGLVMYNLLYVGDDGKLTSADLNSEYTAKLNCAGYDLSGLTAENLPYVTQLISCACRATGPRKLSLSARMYTKAVSTVQSKHTEIITDKSDTGEKTRRNEADLSLERHILELVSSDMVRQSTTGNVKGRIHENSDSKIITCNVTAGVTDIRQGDRDIKISGTVYLSCLFTTTDGKYYSVNECCPFENTVSIGNGIKKNVGDVSATVRCAGLNVNGNGNGDYDWELEYDLDVIYNVTHTSSFTDDIYSTAFETTCDKEDISSFVCLLNGNSRLSLNASRMLGDGGNKSVCHTIGKAVTDRTEYTCDGKFILSGSCSIHTLIENEGRITSEEITIPIKFESLGKPSDGANYTVCSVTVMNAHSKLDGNKLTVDAELCISYMAYTVDKTKCVQVCTVDITKPIEVRGSCVKVYFPEENETLWDIGKKYHCKSEKIEVLGKNMPVIINV